MKTFVKPLWWLPVFLIPQVLLFLYEFSIYSIVKTDDTNTNQVWVVLGIVQLSVFILCLGYIMFTLLKKRSVHWIFPSLLMISQILLMFWFFSHERDFISWSVPNWMVDRDEFFLLFFAFTMPSLFFSILQLVSYTVKEEGKKQLPLSLFFTLLIPLGWYLYVSLIIPPLYQSENYEYQKMMEHIAVVLGIISLVVFFFFLIRSLLLIGRTMIQKPIVRAIMVLICCLVAPLLGLWLNNNGDKWSGGNIFGDFSHWLFYALTVFNAVLLLIPSMSIRWLERTLIGLRFLTLPFSLYFLIVFIPFLPLSIAAMLAAGAGILLLAPVANFIIHVHRIGQDLNNKEIFPTRTSRSIVALPFFVLPLIVHINFTLDRSDLHNALDWIYAPDYRQKSTEVNPDRISYVLDVIVSTGRNRGMFQQRKYWKPYLSSYYRWWVLDNLTLSGKKISDLERIFVGTNYYQFSDNFTPSPSTPEVVINSIKTETQLDKSGTYYKSMVHLELENRSEQQQEFICRISLPEGTWISDYYLDIGGKREHGILAEKRTAQWVYRNIVNRRRDPGIVSYVSGNELELRVFPMEVKEKRLTGFEIVHTGAIQFPLGNSRVSIEKPSLPSTTSPSIKMIRAEEKISLPSSFRKKKYYLLIDNSTAVKDPKEKKKLLDRVQDDLKLLLDSAGPIELYAVHHSASQLGLKAWRPLAESREPKGGFFVERAMKMLLINHYQTPDLTPVFLVYSPKATTLSSSFQDLSFAFPDVDRFFVSTEDGAYPISYRSETKGPDSLDKSTSAASLAIHYQPEKTVRWNDPSGKSFIMPATGNSLLLLEEKFVELNKEVPLWKNAAVQQGNVRFLYLHPELSERNWRKLAGQNFETGILSPYTSYLVVETEAQKEVLRQKQKEVMNAAQYFDLEQEFISMAEPEWWWYGLMLAIIFFVFKNKKVQLR